MSFGCEIRIGKPVNPRFVIKIRHVDFVRGVNSCSRLSVDDSRYVHVGIVWCEKMRSMNTSRLNRFPEFVACGLVIVLVVSDKWHYFEQCLGVGCSANWEMAENLNPKNHGFTLFLHFSIGIRTTWAGT